MFTFLSTFENFTGRTLPVKAQARDKMHALEEAGLLAAALSWASFGFDGARIIAIVYSKLGHSNHYILHLSDAACISQIFRVAFSRVSK